MKINILLYLIIYLLLGSCVPLNSPINKASNQSFATPTITDSSTFNPLNNTISYTLNYSGAQNITLKPSDVTLVTTGTANGIISVSGTGLNFRTITISSITGVGTLGIAIASNTATSVVGAPYPAFGPSAPLSVFSPTSSVSISLPSINDTRTGPVSFTVNYANAANITLTPANIVLHTTGSSNAGSIVISGSDPSTRTVTLYNITGDGTLGISVVGNTATDYSGNYFPASATSALVTTHGIGPSMVISAPSASIVSTGIVTYTVTYTNAASISLQNSDIIFNKPNGSNAIATANVTTTGASTRLITITTTGGDGDLGFYIKAGSALDVVGNLALASSNSATFVVDNTAPTISLSAPTLTQTNTGPVNFTVNYTGASAITLNVANIHVNTVSGNATGNISVTGTGNTTRTISVSNITGDGVLSITIDAGTASDVVNNLALAGGTSQSFTVMNSRPSVSIRATPSPASAITNSGPIVFTLDYIGATAITLQSSDISLNKTGTANAANVAITTTSATTRTVTLTGITGDGTLGITIAANTAFDSVGNMALASAPSTLVTVDNTAPTIIYSNSPSVAVTNSGLVTYTLTYVGASTINLNAPTGNGYVQLNKTGTANGTVAVTENGAIRTISISGITGDGTLGISILANSAVDLAGNNASANSATTTFNVDNTKPFISSISAPSITTTTTGPVTYTVNYTGASQITLSPSDITLNNLGTVTCSTVSVTNNGATSATVTLSGISGDGTLGISIGTNTASDLAGNLALAYATPSTTFTVANDPLFPHAWHLNNTGLQTAFSASAGVAGIDLGVLIPWAKGFTGTGIKVLVSDTGVESTHEDIQANFLSGVSASKDFVLGTAPNYLYTTALPYYSPVGGEHGTAVAGLIAAPGGNGLGSLGVAPGARLASANFLNPTITIDSNMLIDQVSDSGTTVFDIVNQSWGTDQCKIFAPTTLYENQLKLDRKVYVKAAGNWFDKNIASTSCKYSGSPPINPIPNPIVAIWRHANSNFDEYNVNPYTIVVAAVNANGTKSTYSTLGSNIWISGLGGEYGDTNPAMITTDLAGCTYGEAPRFYDAALGYSPLNPFQRALNGTNVHALNPNCNYTAQFNGTSAASPTVSGAVAILLQAAKSVGITNLSTRDVKHILAKTARKIDASAGATSNYPWVPSPTGYIWEQGWITNAAGNHFHNYYGFGLIDTNAAVNMVTSTSTPYSQLPPELQTGYIPSPVVTLAIPDNSATGVTNAINILSNYTVEAVQIIPSITHADIGQLGIELTSPSGTKSILMNINNSLEGLPNINSGEVFLSNAFYGESSAGNWTIKVIDGAAGTTGTLNSWKINIIGH